jgi:hypothetical protein
MTEQTTVPASVRRYFELAPSPDTDAYFALFADDALVEDENIEHRGIADIRAWRAAVPQVSYEITDVEHTPGGVTATATITGDFPGSPFAGLKFHFEHDEDDRIRRLRIHP